VPQGSVLGPILFLLYSNDLDRVLADVQVIMYADDTSLIISNKDEDCISEKGRQVLESMSDWCRLNCLYLNPSKTQVVRFHNRQVCRSLDLNVGDIAINNVPEVKFLGLMIDKNITWKCHCTNLIKKLSSLCFLFRNLKQVLTEAQLIMLYHAQVASRLRYGICLWGNSSMIGEVFILQKRILRIIAGVPTTYSCRDIFAKFNILTLHSLYVYELCIYIYHNRNKFVLNRDFHGINTRQKDGYVPFSKYKISCDSPNILGLKVYNHLPLNIREVTISAKFSNLLKKFLMNKSCYSLDEYFNV
jgi:Reverse transcriptase (RNA-dependent DNA polymerase)